jgi:hypothetical protein
MACVTGTAPWQWEDVVTDLGLRQADVAQQSDVVVIRTLDDIATAHRDGTVKLIFGREAATPIHNEVDKLDVLYGLGVRQIGIAYSDFGMANRLAGRTLDNGEARRGRSHRAAPGCGASRQPRRSATARILSASAPPARATVMHMRISLSEAIKRYQRDPDARRPRGLPAVRASPPGVLRGQPRAAKRVVGRAPRRRRVRPVQAALKTHRNFEQIPGSRAESNACSIE